MWLFCPKCNAENKVSNTDLYGVKTCKACSYKFRGIHAKENKVKQYFKDMFSMAPEETCATYCPFCKSTIFTLATGPGRGGWPSVCPRCSRDLPTDIPEQSQTEQCCSTLPTPKYTHRMSISDPDGCGPCTKCGHVFQMFIDHAVCPKCNSQMSRNEAFNACSNYPHAYPPENQNQNQNLPNLFSLDKPTWAKW